jgi:hypothetical protein
VRLPGPHIGMNGRCSVIRLNPEAPMALSADGRCLPPQSRQGTSPPPQCKLHSCLAKPVCLDRVRLGSRRPSQAASALPHKAAQLSSRSQGPKSARSGHPIGRSVHEFHRLIHRCLSQVPSDPHSEAAPSPGADESAQPAHRENGARGPNPYRTPRPPPRPSPCPPSEWPSRPGSRPVMMRLVACSLGSVVAAASSISPWANRAVASSFSISPTR